MDAYIIMCVHVSVVCVCVDAYIYVRVDACMCECVDAYMCARVSVNAFVRGGDAYVCVVWVLICACISPLSAHTNLGIYSVHVFHLVGGFACFSVGGKPLRSFLAVPQA